MSASISKTPKISIIIPVYNLKPVVSNCLESCIHQSFQDIEIVVINDGSTDGSDEIIEQYRQKDFRIKHIKKQNEGLSFARKTGVEHAVGEYVFHLDGDDTITEKALETLYKEAKEQSADIVAGDIILFKGKNIHQYKLYSAFGRGTATAFLEFILRNQFHYLWGKLIKRSLYTNNEIEIVKEVKVIGEDQMQLYQLCMFAIKVSTVNTIIYEYRINDNSITKAPMENRQFTAHREYYAYVMHRLLTRFNYNDFIRQQINFKILIALYEGINKTGCFVVDKKRSGSILAKTLLNSIFSKRTLLFKKGPLLIRCAAVWAYSGAGLKLKNISSKRDSMTV
jgi:glycosyltransferase involved in cell wall biosynthesis